MCLANIVRGNFEYLCESEQRFPGYLSTVLWDACAFWFLGVWSFHASFVFHGAMILLLERRVDTHTQYQR